MRNIKVKKGVIVITDMNNEEYIGDVQVDSGNGRTVAIAVKNRLEEKGIQRCTLYKDVQRWKWLKDLSGISFHWFVCSLHVFESKFRCLWERQLDQEVLEGHWVRRYSALRLSQCQWNLKKNLTNFRSSKVIYVCVCV